MIHFTRCLPTYALINISVTLLGKPTQSDADLDLAVRAQLQRWFGRNARKWPLLRTYRLFDALPETTDLTAEVQTTRVDAGLFACGDYRATASINGAMQSGRRAAEEVLAELGYAAPPPDPVAAKPAASDDDEEVE
ncbi:MAG: FAD-dependent oxidoreductase [Acidobacteria bacterium]|nr:FAD-dependent oxidoreductase [Acidobacteriota bacterium]